MVVSLLRRQFAVIVVEISSIAVEFFPIQNALCENFNAVRIRQAGRGAGWFGGSGTEFHQRRDANVTLFTERLAAGIGSIEAEMVTILHVQSIWFLKQKVVGVGDAKGAGTGNAHCVV